MSDQDELRELEEQTRRASLFAQAVASEQIARANQTEAAVYGLIDLLIEKGALSADEVAAAIAYLASPTAASVTGTALAVDGGMAGLRLRPVGQ